MVDHGPWPICWQVPKYTLNTISLVNTEKSTPDYERVFLYSSTPLGYSTWTEDRVNVRIGSIPGEAPNPLPSHLRHAFRPIIVGLRIVINCIIIIIIIIIVLLLLYYFFLHPVVKE